MKIPAYNKFGNIRTSGAASKGEAALHEYLLWRQKAGEIRNVRTQQSVYLTDARIQYIADFAYEVRTGYVDKDRFDLWESEWAEFKGFETDTWRIKRRLWMHYGPGRLVVYKGSATKLSQFEVLDPWKKEK